MASTILRTGLKTVGSTLLLIIICIFVSIKIILACFAHVCKQATEIVRKEMLQTHVNIFYFRIQHYINMKKLPKMDLCP